MAIDPIVGASPRLVLPPDVVTAVPDTGTASSQTTTDHPPPRTPAPRASRVEVSFHEDLRALMTRVLDSQTGEVLSEYPAKQVLDTVADLLRAISAREEV